jgi:hypothetical protein
LSRFKISEAGRAEVVDCIPSSLRNPPPHRPLAPRRTLTKRRKQRGKAVKTTPGSPGGADDAVGRAGPVRLFEALVEGDRAPGREPLGARGLLIELPGGSRMLVESPVQLQMAAELVALIAQSARARC